MRVGERVVPAEVIVDYCNHLRGSRIIAKRMGIEGYEYERQRLHNRIFLAAGFKDTQWGTARRTAAWFGTMTFRDKGDFEDIGYDPELVKFKEDLDVVVGDILDG